jgi:DNA polymerase sigma
VIVKATVPGRVVKYITAMFRRIISALRANQIIPSGAWNEVGIQMITQAKCPIIKLKTLQGTLSAGGNTRMSKPLHRIETLRLLGNISVDISVYDDGGIRASRIVGGYLKQYPVARDLVLLVKAYMRKYKLNEVFLGGLGSYSTFCLVISFLQVRIFHFLLRSSRRSLISPYR